MKKIFITICIVFILSFGLSQPSRAQEASFYLSPASGSYDLGRTFSVNLLINSGGAAINAAQATIYFPSTILKVIDVSKINSIFTLWIQEPIYSNSKGEISFGGGLPSPGFRGAEGKVITIYFQGKSAGKAEISFGGEAILANDPWGTNLFSYSSRGTYFIGVPEEIPEEVPELAPAAPKVSSPTHPQPEKWYSNNNPELQWILGTDITGVSTALNQKSIFDPGNVSEGVFSSKTFEGLEDGVWYFHIKLQNKNGWGRISHFKLQIDTQSPHPFDITVDNEGDSTNPRPLLYFQAQDDTSGISHYEIKIGKGDIFSIVEVQTNPFHLPLQNPGTHSLEIKAVDRAGNKTLSISEVKIESIGVPEITVCQDVFLAGEELLLIEGSALPNVKILLFFKKDEILVKKWEVFSDEKGNWSLTESGLFKSGIYKILARAQDSRGATSNPSEGCVVRVILKGITLGPWIISYETITLLFIFLFFVGLAIVIYLIWRMQRTKRAIDRESKDLKKKFYKEYQELREDIQAQLEMLKEAKSQRELTGKEKEMERRLLKDLYDIERVIREELKDIEEIR